RAQARPAPSRRAGRPASRSCAPQHGVRAGEAVPPGAVAYRAEGAEHVLPAALAAVELAQAFMQGFVRLALRRRGEVRGADRTRAAGEARLEPAPKRLRLRFPPAGAQREQHAAEIVIARRREPRAEADQALGFSLERVARHPALERLERRLRVRGDGI